MSCIESITHFVGPQFFQPHWHQADLLMFIYNGQVDVKIAGKQYHISKPSVIFICHLENHVFLQMDADYSRYALYITHETAHNEISDSDRLMSLFMNRPENDSHVLDVSTISEELQTLFSMLLAEKRCNDFPEGQSALLQCILQRLYRHSPQSFSAPAVPLSGTVRKIQRRFEDNPADDTSLDELASEFFLSVSHLTHSFKRTTGYSIGKYRLLCRISAAKKLLIGSDIPISAISSQCGFADMSNFCRYFRQEVGCSPSEFRKKMSKK